MTDSAPQATEIQIIIGTDEEIADMVSRFKRLKKHEGMKLPNGESYSRDDLIHLLSKRDPRISTLVEIYRTEKQRLFQVDEAALLDALENAPNQDMVMHEGIYISSNPNEYTIEQIVKHIREKTPEGVEFVKMFHELRLKSKIKNQEISVYLESNTYKVMIRIRGVIEWGRLLVSKVLKSNTKFLK